MRQAEHDVPFILVTGTLGEEVAVECIKQGVTDYVLKEHLARLPLVVARTILCPCGFSRARRCKSSR
jgi:CheY-like chemotaxis protein